MEFNEDGNLDFIEIPGTKRRTISDLEIKPRTHKMEDGTNVTLDMRITNRKIEIDKDNIAHVRLIFKLDYHPNVFIDEYTLFSTFAVDVLDRNRVLETDPLSALSVAYLATHFKENGERLFQELNKQSKDKFFTALHGGYFITDDEAQDQTYNVLKGYFA